MLDVAILGVDGIDAEVGATAHHEGEASINRLMARRAARVIVTADSSKASRAGDLRAVLRTAEDVGDLLVTDSGLDRAQLASSRSEDPGRGGLRRGRDVEVVAELAGWVIAAQSSIELQAIADTAAGRTVQNTPGAVFGPIERRPLLGFQVSTGA